MKSFLQIAGALILFSWLFSCSPTLDKDIRKELEELDDCIKERDALEREKLSRIAVLKKSFDDNTIPLEAKLAVLDAITVEYNSYCFDSLVVYLEKTFDIASELGYKETADIARIRLASAFASSGYHHKSKEIFMSLDTTGFTRMQYKEYYLALCILSDGSEEIPSSAKDLILELPFHSYIEKLMHYADSRSTIWKFYRMKYYICEREYHKAIKAADELLEELSPGSSYHAYTAFCRSIVCDSLFREKESLFYLIKAAQSDMVFVNKNYSALTKLARRISSADPERAFKYIKLAVNDGISYSGIYRPWQIANVLPDIQTSFLEYMREDKIKTIAINVILGILLLLLLVFSYFSYRYYRSKSRLNEQLERSKILREHYIAQFIMRQSSWIDRMQSFHASIIKEIHLGHVDALLKRLSISDDINNEIDIFYKNFDETFLALFPTFVEDFNELLIKEARKYKYSSKGGKALTPEQRIYALVRLGIDDSNEIAKVLKYSVRTIYNYKVRTMNASIIPRDQFEEYVRRIE